MKKLFIGMLFMLPSIALVAQGIGVGIKAGVNFANVDAENISTSSITSWHAGGYVNINVSEKFGITPELLYTVYGFTWEEPNLGNAEINTHYFSIPVMFRFKPISLISLEAGPQFNFLTSAEADNQDIKDDLKNTEVCLGLGAGVHLPLGFNGGVRYILGFTDINDSDFSNASIKNRTFQIYVGWTLFGAK
jgi:hypothetical protein